MWIKLIRKVVDVGVGDPPDGGQSPAAGLA